MNLTATWRYFQASRATTSNGFRARFGNVAEGSWIGKIREGYHSLIDALSASLHSWRPLDSEYAQEAIHRLSRVYDRCDAMAWRVRDACTLAFWRVYERCDPALSKFYDSCVPALERTAHAVEEIAERAAARRDLSLIVVVVALPAVAFLFFAAANWLADDGPAATEGLAGSPGAYTLHETHTRISTTLVEPPAFGRTESAERPPAVTFLVARAEGPRPIVEAAVARDAILRDSVAREVGFEPSQVEPAGGDLAPATLEDARPAAVEETVQVAALPDSAGQTAPSTESSREPVNDLYPFMPKPRPWRSAGADTRAASLVPAAAAVAVPKPDRSAGAGGPSGTFYQIQLAAVRSRNQALSLWESLNRTDSDLLGVLEPDISTRTTRRNQSIYRLRAGPLNNRTDANALCSALKSRKVECMVITAGG